MWAGFGAQTAQAALGAPTPEDYGSNPTTSLTAHQRLPEVFIFGVCADERFIKKIEVTPEMRDAGAAIIEAGGWGPEDLAVLTYRAMRVWSP
jgi:hypothetical protein